MTGLGHSPYFPCVVTYNFFSAFLIPRLTARNCCKDGTLILLTVPHAPVMVLSHPNVDVVQD